MMLVTNEHIAAGHEIRIDYEDGAPAGMYWGDAPPADAEWRSSYVRPPPPIAASPVLDRLEALQAAAASGLSASACSEVEPPCDPIAWDGSTWGDQRLCAAVLLLDRAGGTHKRGSQFWALAATHIPGRSGEDCRRRWPYLEKQFGL